MPNDTIKAALRDMTTGEADAYRRGWADAAEVARCLVRVKGDHLPHLKARDYPDDLGRLVDDIESDIRNMECPLT